jgi:hypothetical protein
MQEQCVIFSLHQQMHGMYLNLLDHNMEVYQHMFQPNKKKYNYRIRIFLKITVIVSVWLSSAVVFIFDPLSILVDPLFEYLARISSADIVSVGWCSVWEWSSSGILRSRRWELLLLPVSRRRNADMAFDERFSLDLFVDDFERKLI